MTEPKLVQEENANMDYYVPSGRFKNRNDEVDSLQNISSGKEVTDTVLSSEYFANINNPESPSMLLGQRTFRHNQVRAVKKEEDAIDYADILKMREYGNYEKRLKKSMEIRNQTSQNVKIKNWSRYLKINNKNDGSNSYSLYQPSFITPRNEYPILS